MIMAAKAFDVSPSSNRVRHHVPIDSSIYFFTLSRPFSSLDIIFIESPVIFHILSYPYDTPRP